MTKIDYTRADTLDVALFMSDSPLEKADGIQTLLDAIEAHAGPFVPTQIAGRTVTKYSRAAVEKQIKQQKNHGKVVLDLIRGKDPEVSYEMSFVTDQPTRFWIRVVIPFTCFEGATALRNADAVVDLVRALATVSTPVYGYAHSKGDLSLGSDPHAEDPFASEQVYEAYWLNLYGPSLVDRIGRAKVTGTPAGSVESLPNGAVLILTRPTPADFASPEARQAQARVLAHLRPETNYDEGLKQLMARSAHLAPAQRSWDQEIADLLALTLDSVSYADRERRAESLNNYHPPPVTEFKPLAQLAAADVDERAAIEEYEHHAEKLVALLHKDVPEAMSGSPDFLPRIDYHFWHFDYPVNFSRTDIDNDLRPAVGAFIGQMMVEHLGGRWVPRQNIEESQVVRGDRAWLPFLRARYYLQSKQSVLDYSLTQYYRVAERS